jgi:hypothetical protein
MPDDMNQAVLELLGWLFVATIVGSYIVWRVYEYRRPRRERFEAEWQARFEPNRPNAGERPQWGDNEPTWVDAEFVRLMQALPDDHLPADAREWGDKAGNRKREL